LILWIECSVCWWLFGFGKDYTYNERVLYIKFITKNVQINLFSNIDYENDTFITQFSEENGESKLTGEENLFNNLPH
jgi:hypothetical protein